jgi:hypothetical protein
VKRGKATLPKSNFRRTDKQTGRRSGPKDTKKTPFGQSRKLFHQNHIFLPEIDGMLTNLCKNDGERAAIW